MFGSVVNLQANYREALAYASRTAGTAMDYDNGPYRTFMLQLMQTIPTEIQNPLLAAIAKERSKSSAAD
jgi:hypothetical protein